ncbi:MAG: hypothetical protein HKM93_22100 [Desulfobacteraceae bacterium]|nr:hypothetical protein [Desulfobacteraceae bacterium]
MSKQDRHPNCFSDLSIVFPMAADGLRHTPRSCMICVYKTECLRAAMEKSEGVDVREEVVDRAYSSGMLGFFERWSRKKSLHRQRFTKRKGSHE